MPSRLLKRDVSGALHVRQGGGCLALFGLPFFSVGLLVLGSVLGLVPLRHPGGVEDLVLGGMGLVFTAAGTTMLFLRWGTTVDPQRGMAADWWHVLFLGRRRERPLGEFDRVSLRADSGGESVSYAVELAGIGKPLRIAGSGDVIEARRAAEEVAQALTLPVVDSTTGVTQRREAGHLDESLAASYRRTGTEPPWPERPATLESTVEERPDGVRVRIPGPGFSVQSLAPAGCALMFALVAMLTVGAPLRSRHEPTWDLLVAALVVTFVVLPPVVAAIARRRSRVLVDASPGGLRIDERWGWRRRITEIPADELEELTAPTRLAVAAASATPRGAEIARALSTGIDAEGHAIPGWMRLIGRLAKAPGLTARSDRASVTFGAHLPEEEQQYVAAVLLRALTGTQR